MSIFFFLESNEWTGTWGKHMKSINFKVLRDYQKINHFPGTFQIGRKDRLWRNLFRLMAKFGKKEFGFIPKTYVLPQDSKMLRAAWERSNGKEAWIIKPVNLNFLLEILCESLLLKRYLCMSIVVSDQLLICCI